MKPIPMATLSFTTSSTVKEPHASPLLAKKLKIPNTIPNLVRINMVLGESGKNAKPRMIVQVPIWDFGNDPVRFVALLPT